MSDTDLDAADAADDKDAADAPEEQRMGCLVRLIPVTTPGCASMLTAVFLATTMATIWLMFYLDPENVPWQHSFSWLRILGLLGLLIAIPIVVYKTIQLWLDGMPNSFPELDYAWRAGLNALANNELSPSSVPLFVITGSSGEAQEKAIMNATGLRFSVEGVPQGPAPIHWYANSEAIYLFCSDASWSSALASLREEIAQEAASSGLNAESPMMPISYPSQPALRIEPAPTEIPQAKSQNIKGTLELNEFVNPMPAPPKSTPFPSPAPQSPSQGSFRGTLILGNDSFEEPKPVAAEIRPAPRVSQQALGPVSAYGSASSGANRGPTSFSSENNPLSDRKPVLVSHQYSTSCLQELQYLGQLLRKVRQPLCPINGVLALIPFESIHAPSVEVEELKKAIRGDLETIRFAFQLRVPVTALVVGLEKERGFRELVFRVGRERSMTQRFGRRFDIHSIPTKDQLGALTTHVCGVFEDWCYTLFREEQALTRPGNTRLYELLSKVRCNWKGRLSEILSGGFGCDGGKRDEEASVLFSGCYFAATGDSTDRQAFVKGVIEKLGEEQELIEWAPEALRANQWHSFSASLGMIVSLLLGVALLVMYFLIG